MDEWNHLFSSEEFLGVDWSVWKIVGWLGNVTFFSRFFVQWYATEKKKLVVVPQAFWWLSLVGSLLLLAYSIHQKDSVFIFAYAFTWIPYIRNLMIHRRNKRLQVKCLNCGEKCAPKSNFCVACGAKLAVIS
ncbi:MAG TPA: lipid-A-disaccharide synthase N-terminal domain-containing protein [Verrucomicrobiae bacterium]|nr:lipid-A-disaccharide synthase N-terminal domain-containing protein [Verrucomicrobiae bacterium]